ncbi:hypothetical protein [Thermococcus sp.]|uniref:hypothetical protein n=1 Tax=Thermococcus sp. TaxID=35749 RepID=UPI002628AB32|nr:hypothetical protein [Thermococcus sp.]
MDRGEVKKLVKEAYEFGYFVGYKGHSAWAEWVRNTRERLYSEAEGLGVYDVVKAAYNRGREEGAKKRGEEIHFSLIEKGTVREENPKPKFKQVKVKTPPEEKLEEEFIRFTESTKILLPPEILSSIKNLEIPKMLRLDRK